MSMLDPLEGLTIEECQLLFAKEMAKSRRAKNYRLLNLIHTKHNSKELHPSSPLSGLTQEVTPRYVLTQDLGPHGPYFVATIPSNFNKHLLMFSRKELVKWANKKDQTKSASSAEPSYTEVYSQPNLKSKDLGRFNFNAKHDVLRKWMFTFGCSFKILPSRNGDIIRVDSITSDSPGNKLAQLNRAAKYVDQILNDPFYFEHTLYSELTSKSSIYVDISNILVASQIIFDKSEKKLVRDASIRVNIDILHEIIVGFRKCTTKIACGSTSMPTADLHVPWQNNHYNVYVEQIESGEHEQFVDTTLVVHLQHELLSSVIHSPSVKKKFIILTGDGNKKEGNGSISSAIENVLKLGHSVELYCWKHSVNKCYVQMSRDYPIQMSIIYLDRFRDVITFQKTE